MIYPAVFGEETPFTLSLEPEEQGPDLAFHSPWNFDPMELFGLSEPDTSCLSYLEGAVYEVLDVVATEHNGQEAPRVIVRYRVIGHVELVNVGAQPVEAFDYVPR